MQIKVSVGYSERASFQIGETTFSDKQIEYIRDLILLAHMTDPDEELSIRIQDPNHIKSGFKNKRIYKSRKDKS